MLKKQIISVCIVVFLCSIFSASAADTLYLCHTEMKGLKANNTTPNVSFQWFKDGVAIPSIGDNGDSITIQNQFGVYQVLSQNINGGCSSILSDSLVVMRRGPIAKADAAITTIGLGVNITIAANDESGCHALDFTSIEIVNAPQHGTSALLPPAPFSGSSFISPGTISYIPEPGFVGKDTLYYVIKDVQGGTSNVAMVIIDVIGPDLVATIELTPSQVNVNGEILQGRIVVAEINNVVTNGSPILVSIPASANYEVLPYENALTISNGSVVLNNEWQYIGQNSGQHSWVYIGNSMVMEASGASAFGIKIKYNHGARTGSETIAVTIFGGSGGETVPTNNSDSEIIRYKGN